MKSYAMLEIGKTGWIEKERPVCVLRDAIIRPLAASNIRSASLILAVGTRPNCVEAAKFYGATDTISYKDGDKAVKALALTYGKRESIG